MHQKNFGMYWINDKKKQYNSIISAKEFDKNLKMGGMPELFFLRDESEWEQQCQSWIETTCFRDLSRILKKNFDPELALNVFTEVIRSLPPTATEVANKLNKDSRVVKRYLDALTQILVLIKISPYLLGVGKDHYIAIDSGLVHFNVGSEEAQLRSHVLIQALSLFENNGLGRPQVFYYHSTKKSFVPLIFYWPHRKFAILVQIANNESPGLASIASMESLIKKIELSSQNIKCRKLILNLSGESYFENGIEFHSLRS